MTYETTDIFTCLCFLRIYFIIDAIFVWLPINVLYGKRVCRESGVEPNFAFQFKAVFKQFPYASFGVLALFCVMVNAFIIRVWERPYYELMFDPPYLEFTDL